MRGRNATVSRSIGLVPKPLQISTPMWIGFDGYQRYHNGGRSLDLQNTVMPKDAPDEIDTGGLNRQVGNDLSGPPGLTIWDAYDVEAKSEGRVNQNQCKTMLRS